MIFFSSYLNILARPSKTTHLDNKTSGNLRTAKIMKHYMISW